jgi:hypothetical protein
VALLIELSLNNDEGLSVARESLGLCLIHQEGLADEAVEIRDLPIEQRVELCYWILV